MRLAAHSDTAYLNVSKSCSRSGAHKFLSKEKPKQRYNGPILAISQIIKFVVFSAAEAELAALFISANDMVLLGGELIKSTLVIWTFLSFELADIFKCMGVVYFSKKLKKTSISILIANDEANTTP